ncbi:MAG: Asp-tRNA(Asn)/Glu-tRNA(Gln) amidotransferase subunit GatC [Candidatus Nomurabacteria bacterium]|nr:MAG: Asp-tRNA(Asn)/Glu-tRNA(Gln) amidotransferase subunit GatC [Candidatus Nomurabacteria bacterium]
MSSKYAKIDLLADMAKIALTDEEQKKLEKELQSILAYVQVLDKVDTSSTPPTRHVSGLINQTREDKIVPSDHASEITRQSPRRSGFEIPSVRSLWTSKK